MSCDADMLKTALDNMPKYDISMGACRVLCDIINNDNASILSIGDSSGNRMVAEKLNEKLCF